MRTQTYDFKLFLNGEKHKVIKREQKITPISDQFIQPKSTIVSKSVSKTKTKVSKFPKLSLIPLTTAPLLSATVVGAESIESLPSQGVRDKMMDAFDPLIELIQGMAYPVAMVVVLGGAIFVMIGNSDKGFGMMQKAGLGYLLVMIAPMVLDVLVDSMKGVV